MIHLMDSTGRIIALHCRFHGTAGSNEGSLSAEEIVLGLLQRLPERTLLRGPYASAEIGTAGKKRKKEEEDE